MHETLIGKKLISVMLIVAFTAVSCTSYRVVELPDIKNRVRGSDIVRVVTTDGQKVKFEVTAITSDAIIGDNQRILFSDIATLELQLYRDERDDTYKMSVAEADALRIILEILGGMASGVVGGLGIP